MLLGAFIHAGLEPHFLVKELGKLQLDGLRVETETRMVNAISAVKVNISGDQRQQLRTLPVILQILQQSRLDNWIISRATEVFQALAGAEAKVHDIAIDKVHFHEVGAIDTIVDVVGCLIGMHHLGISRLFCSPLPTGHGFVKCAHGLLPLPAPAVCELLEGVPTYGVELQQELITPTGAALVTTLAKAFGPLPSMSICSTGYGAGSQVLSNGQPNLLRLIVGEAGQAKEEQRVEVIETNLDDWPPEGFPYLYQKLFDQGALDVTLTPIQMKKGRPGFCLQVISPLSCSHQLKDIIFRETSSIGLRFRTESRRTLPRKKITVLTPWGEVIAKEVQTPAGTIIYPEYEECLKIAASHGVPLQDVYHQVRSSRSEKP